MRKISVAVMMLVFMGLAGATCFAGQDDAKNAVAASSANVVAPSSATVNAAMVNGALFRGADAAGMYIVKIGTETAVADMRGISPQSQKKIYQYLQNSFDYLSKKKGGVNYEVTKTWIHLSDDELFQAFNVMGRMLTMKEYDERNSGKGPRTIADKKEYFYLYLSMEYLGNCERWQSASNCITKELIPRIQSTDTDDKVKDDLVDLIISVDNDNSDNKKIRSIISKAMIPIFTNKNNPMFLRIAACILWIAREDSYEAMKHYIEEIKMEPELFLGASDKFILLVEKAPGLAEYFFKILEHPHEYPDYMVKGAYNFIEGDAWSFGGDTDGSRRKREKQILHNFQADPRMVKLFSYQLRETLDRISYTEKRWGLK